MKPAHWEQPLFVGLGGRASRGATVTRRRACHEGASYTGRAFDALRGGAAGDPGLGNQAELGVNTGSVTY